MKELLSIGVIGTGNCGGQFADAANGEGFDAIAVNASQDDLDSLVNDGVIHILVGDGNGTGKNRDEAREFLTERTAFFKEESVISFVLSHDVCVIATSIGGGFGSGTSLEITKILMQLYPDKLFIPAGVMPFSAEGFTAQEHSVQWLQDLEEMDVPYFLYDNNRFAGEKEQIVCNKVCGDFLTDLHIMRGDFVGPTITGGIDPRDLLTVYSTPGRLVSACVQDIDDDDLVDKSLIKTIQNYINEKSAHADLVDDKQILASATMYYLPSEFDPYKGTVRSDLQETFGSHIGDYANFADMDDTNPEMVSCIAVTVAGLSAPQTRIGRLVKRRDSLADAITTRKVQESRVKGVGRTQSSSLKLKAKSFRDPGTKAPVNVDQVLSQFSKNTDHPAVQVGAAKKQVKE